MRRQKMSFHVGRPMMLDCTRRDFNNALSVDHLLNNMRHTSECDLCCVNIVNITLCWTRDVGRDRRLYTDASKYLVRLPFKHRDQSN